MQIKNNNNIGLETNPNPTITNKYATSIDHNGNLLLINDNMITTWFITWSTSTFSGLNYWLFNWIGLICNQWLRFSIVNLNTWQLVGIYSSKLKCFKQYFLWKFLPRYDNRSFTMRCNRVIFYKYSSYFYRKCNFLSTIHVNWFHNLIETYKPPLLYYITGCLHDELSHFDKRKLYISYASNSVTTWLPYVFNTEKCRTSGILPYTSTGITTEPLDKY